MWRSLASTWALGLCMLSAQALRIIEAQNLGQVAAEFSHLLGAESQVMFRLVERGTFLAPKQLQFWDVETELGEHADSIARGPEWVEWGFDDIVASDYLHHIPVSPCHSEVAGHGGSIYFRDIVASDQVRGASYGVSSDILAGTLELTAGVSLARSEARSTTFTCSAKHGEIVQVFLRNTHFLHFTPRFRVLWYHARRAQFRGPTRFTVQPRQKEVVASGVGELVCGSSAVVALSCDAVVADVRAA